ncbi:hypothetical protein COTS27_01491 [Spirochaetota bacterium]|nr:hypothetical protein COTS27_01491 [Spirochaetota bacterium]
MNKRLSPMPRQAVPDLEIPLLTGGTWNIKTASCERFFLVVFYRGYHCPICKPYLQELNALSKDLEAHGVVSIAVSTDVKERAERSYSEWNLAPLKLGYGLSVDTGRNWGLFVSSSRGKTSTGVLEPDFFTEPGLFLVRADRTLYSSAIQTMPFMRPSFSDLVKALDFIIKKDYPARGEVQ